MFVLQDSPRGDDYYGERGKEAKGLKWGQSGGGGGQDFPRDNNY